MKKLLGLMLIGMLFLAAAPSSFAAHHKGKRHKAKWGAKKHHRSSSHVSAHR